MEYHHKGFPIYVAEDESGELLGYLVCRVDGEVVSAESLYVRETCRRLGTGSALYAQAEQLAQIRSSDAAYNWMHIGFPYLLWKLPANFQLKMVDKLSEFCYCIHRK